MRTPYLSSLALVSAVLLAGCVKSTTTTRTSEGGMFAINPPAPIPPAPTPTPPPPGPTPVPPPATVTPPLAPTPIDISDNPPIGTPNWPRGDSPDGAHGEDVGGLQCLPTMPDTYHVHSHLSIFRDGVQLQVPNHIGIVDLSPTEECYYTLHTHDWSGKIHVEAEAPGVFTLGQFFTIWGQPLEPDNIAGITGKPVEVYIVDNNGVVVEATGDWHDIELISHRQVTIVVGTPIDEIPNYNWRSN